MEREELLAAGDRNLADTLRLYAATAPGAAIEDDGRVVLVSTSNTWPGPYHNGALRLDRGVEPAEVLARAEAFFAGRTPGYCVWIGAHADADLERAALEAGLAALSERGAPRMAIDHDVGLGTVPPDVALHEVADERGRQDYLAVTVDAYADSSLPRHAAQAQLATLGALAGPGVRAVVAHLEGRAVAAAMTVASGAVAGIQLVGTVPAARRRGLGGLCTRWAVHAGFAAGAQAVVLEASEAGEPVYLGIGFVEVSRYRWCFGPPARPPA
ncbi:MAG TPA: GNAT family N-acetyltransferase [Acidimicrobiales bacterium]|nr:GNAT family N-acetyltransferase [Acidimicrobiales bacterium]